VKFVDQGLFDAASLTTARFMAVDPKAVQSFLTDSFASYQSTFPGDNLWTDQVRTTAKELFSIAKKISPDDYARLLAVTYEIRKTLGDDLKPISKVGKLFGGAFFTKSHPAPSERVAISIKNCRTLLIMVNSRL
jgi:hypothetical protein